LDKRTVSFGARKNSWEFFVGSEPWNERVVFLWWEKVVKAGKWLGNAFKEFTGDIISAASKVIEVCYK